MSISSINIRPVITEDEYHAVELLQREIWGAQDLEIVSFEIMMTAHKNGGVALGAFDIIEGEERLVGFVFGFPGLTEAGELKHCSHIAGALPSYRDRGVVYALKLKQREIVLSQGINLITWTFDPLESRNGRFNFHKLGATCRTYIRNLYGSMRDKLNAGLPSDRFQVDWFITSPRVEGRLSVGADETSVTDLMADPSARGERMLFQIPHNFQRLKADDCDLALKWRLRSREFFEEAFSQGYLVTDLLVKDGQSYYLLEKTSCGPFA